MARGSGLRADAGFVAAGVVVLSAFITVSGRSQSPAPSPTLEAMLARVGERVEQYYARARDLLCVEMVLVQPLGDRLQPRGRARRMIAELRTLWEPAPTLDRTPEPSLVRQILMIDGRKPRAGEGEGPGCMDPRATSPEPLAMLLTKHRGEYTFSMAGTGESEGRAAIMIDYQPRDIQPAQVAWRGSCPIVWSLGQTAGRVWIDADTADVLRVDDHLASVTAVMLPGPSNRNALTMQRSDLSIRYARVSFRDPDETLMLPTSVDTISIVRGATVPRLRVSQTFSGWKRFLVKVDEQIQPVK